MTSLEAQSEAIRLRGLGYSFDSIAATLDISKPTVMKVCNSYLAEIDRLRAEQITATMQDAAEGLEARSKLYKDVIRRVYGELTTRSLADVSTDKLMSMLERAERSLAAIETRPQVAFDSRFSSLSNEDLAAIAKAGQTALLELA